jgi:alpha-methylacyl-CoA racemase
MGGHDINYIAVTGALAATGEADGKPVPPLNLVGDFAGGGMSAVVGVLAALYESTVSGLGQVIDIAMVDGVSTLLATAHGYRSAGATSDQRGSNFMDGGSPHYQTYRCADGEYMAVGAVEPVFFAALIETLGVDVDPADQLDRAQWADIQAKFSAAFLSRTRDEWSVIFADVDACVTPVLTLTEAGVDPQISARGTLTECESVTQPAASPRFSRTPGIAGRPPHRPGADTTAALADWDVSTELIQSLLQQRVIIQS